ncbi:FIST signal transduction protein [Vibrio sp. NH-7]
MDFKTHITHRLNEQEAIEELSNKICRTNLVSIICYFTQNYGAEKLRLAFKNCFPQVSITGCSTCKGLMTERGLHFGSVIGVIAIYDSNSTAYGGGVVSIEDTSVIEEATRAAIDVALRKAERVGEVPSFAIIHSTPGIEEKLISAFDNVFKTPIPIIGATAADNAIKGQWSIFNEDESTSQGISIQLLFPSKPLTTGFSAGYSPTKYQGLITKCQDREIIEIDHMPAQERYRGWISEYSGEDIPEWFKFQVVTQYPLGRIAGTLYNQPYFKLSHPINVTDEQGILLFTNVSQGDVVTLMSGDRQQLISRPARVIREARRQSELNTQLTGAICVICAGAMLHLEEDMGKVYDKIKHEMGDIPFICPFTFGEQGRFINGDNGHGNLMISAATFYSD